MKYIIGIDLGTSGTKTVLFDSDGNVITSELYEYPMYQPENGWAEQDPDDWYNASVTTLKAVVSKVNAEDIVCIGISGQMHGLVMLDEDGKVIRPSIIWCDQRTAKECEQITQLVGKDRLMEITGNPAITGFTASKIMWVKNNEPENYAKCRHILLPKDYVRYKLTGEFATDVSDASGMQLLDIKNRCWSDEVLEKLGIDKALLAKVYESPEVTGAVTEEAAKLTGLKAGTIVVGGAGDNAAAAVGVGVVKDNTAFTTIGTSGVVFAHTSEMTVDPEGRVHTFCCAVPNAWHVMGVTQAAGLSLKWFCSNFCAAEKETAAGMGADIYELTNMEAEKSPIGANRLLYLPYLMGERTPHLDPDCRGVFFGLSAMHTKRDMIRAVMEGVSYSLRDYFEILKGMNITISDMAVCGGGASSTLWRGMLADNYNCSVKIPVSKEGPALGAAILAAVGAGLYESVEAACDTMVSYKNHQQPNYNNFEEYSKYYDVYKNVYKGLKNVYKDLNRI
ncbi:MAG: xylulokinase [Clostridiales bacterium]|nr:xylulokinase [Clostridiales bacterium]